MKKNLIATAWKISKLLLLYFAYQLLFTTIFNILIPNVWGLALGMFLSATAMLLHLFCFGYFSFGKEPLGQTSGKTFTLCILLVFAAMLTMNIVAQWLGLEDNMEHIFQELTHNVLGFISVSILAPALEEILFRGAIQGFLMRKYQNHWIGIIAASLTFGIVHMNPIQIFYASCIGIVFGWIYYRTGSVIPAITGHILNNTLASLLMISGMEETTAETTFTDELGTVILFSAVALFLVRKINRMSNPAPTWYKKEDEQFIRPSENSLS